MMDELYHISLNDLEFYIKENGWIKVEDQKSKKNTLYRGYKNEKGFPLELFVPKSMEFVDYYLRVKDIVKVLSIVLKKTESEIINKIVRSNRDVLKIKVPNPGQGGIPLTYAADSVNAIKNLYMYSAMSEVTNLPHFDKPSVTGRHHASICEFDHTFHGSFGFAINSPVTSNIVQMDLFNEEEIPFERRVMERIIRGLDLIKQSVDNEDADIIVDNYEIGLNSKMCESLLEISDHKKKTVDIAVDWSYKFGVSDDIKNKTSWRLSENEFINIEYAANELKKIEPQLITIFGSIVTLHSTKNPIDEDFLGQVTIKIKLENRLADVKVSIGKDEYAIALEAHGRGVPIKVKGLLIKKGSLWKMVEVEYLTMHL